MDRRTFLSGLSAAAAAAGIPQAPSPVVAAPPAVSFVAQKTCYWMSGFNLRLGEFIYLNNRLFHATREDVKMARVMLEPFDGDVPPDAIYYPDKRDEADDGEE